MEIKQNIIYKKRAVEQLETILKQNKFKKVLFISGKTAYQQFGAVVTNVLAKVDIEFVLKLVNSCPTGKTISDCVSFSNNCDVVICLGGGSVCDISKMVAHKLSLPHIIIPTLPTNCSYFTDYAFVFENNVYIKYETSSALKILIDENIISKTDKKFVIEGQKFILSQFETLFSIQFDNLFYDKQIDIQNLKLQLGKFKDNYEYFHSDTDDSKLVLMDILIELGTYLQNLNFNNVYALAHSIKGQNNYSFGSLCLMSAKILSHIYLNTFSMKKLYVFNLPDFDYLQNSIDYLKLDKKQLSFGPVKKVLNTAVILRANSVKNQTFSLCENLVKDLNEYKLPPNKTQIDTQKLYKCFNILPFVYNCSTIFNLIYGVGLISF